MPVFPSLHLLLVGFFLDVWIIYATNFRLDDSRFTQFPRWESRSVRCHSRHAWNETQLVIYFWVVLYKLCRTVHNKFSTAHMKMHGTWYMCMYTGFFSCKPKNVTVVDVHLLRVIAIEKIFFNTKGINGAWS